MPRAKRTETTVDGKEIVTEQAGDGSTVKRRVDWLLGKRIRDAREGKGWSMSRAAQAAGFSSNSWSVLERGFSQAPGGGHRSVDSSVAVITRAAEVLDLDPNECLAAAGHDAGGPPVARGGRPTRIESDAVKWLRAIPEPAKSKLLDLIEAMAKQATGE